MTYHVSINDCNLFWNNGFKQFFAGRLCVYIVYKSRVAIEISNDYTHHSNMLAYTI